MNLLTSIALLGFMSRAFAAQIILLSELPIENDDTTTNNKKNGSHIVTIGGDEEFSQSTNLKSADILLHRTVDLPGLHPVLRNRKVANYRQQKSDNDENVSRRVRPKTSDDCKDSDDSKNSSPKSPKHRPKRPQSGDDIDVRPESFDNGDTIITDDGDDITQDGVTDDRDITDARDEDIQNDTPSSFPSGLPKRTNNHPRNSHHHPKTNRRNGSRPSNRRTSPSSTDEEQTDQTDQPADQDNNQDEEEAPRRTSERRRPQRPTYGSRRTNQGYPTPGRIPYPTEIPRHRKPIVKTTHSSFPSEQTDKPNPKTHRRPVVVELGEDSSSDSVDRSILPGGRTLIISRVPEGPSIVSPSSSVYPPVHPSQVGSRPYEWLLTPAVSSNIDPSEVIESSEPIFIITEENDSEGDSVVDLPVDGRRGSTFIVKRHPPPIRRHPSYGYIEVN